MFYIPKLLPRIKGLGFTPTLNPLYIFLSFKEFLMNDLHTHQRITKKIIENIKTTDKINMY